MSIAVLQQSRDVGEKPFNKSGTDKNEIVLSNVSSGRSIKLIDLDIPIFIADIYIQSLVKLIKILYKNMIYVNINVILLAFLTCLFFSYTLRD